MDLQPPPVIILPESPVPGSCREATLAQLEDHGEADFLGPGGTPRLVRLAGGSAGGPPIVFIHGFSGDPANQAVLIAEARSRGHAIWVMAYDTVGRRLASNARGFASELARLPGPGHRPLTIVAHSLGALTLKAALDDLAARPAGLPVAGLRVVSISTPWSGLSIADCARLALGERAAPLLLRDLAPSGPTIQGLLARPWPPGVRVEDLVGSRDPLRWLQGVPRADAPGLAPSRALIAGASHNTVLWDPRTVTHVFGRGTRGAWGRGPGFWRTMIDEAAAVMGLPGAFEGRKSP